MIALSDLLTPATTEGVIATINDVLLALGIPADQWNPNGPMSSLRHGVAIAIAGVSGYVVTGIQGGFLDTASFDAKNGGSWLALLARSVYGVEWEGPTFAEGPVTLTNVGGGSFPSNPPFSITLKDPATGKTFKNVDGFSLTAPGQVVNPVFQAVEQGSASTSAPGGITDFETTMLGVTASNAVALVGSDGQSRAELIQACKDKLGSLSPNGPSSAYDFIAKADPTSVPILVRLGLAAQTSQRITRTLPVADGNGGVRLIIATAAGPASDADVAIVNARIQAVCVPFGIRATTESAVPHVVTIPYEAWLKGSSLDITGAELAFSTQFVQYFANLPIGGFVIPPATTGAVLTNALEGQLFTATPGVVEAKVSGADTQMLANEVPVLGAITPTVHLL